MNAPSQKRNTLILLGSGAIALAWLVTQGEPKTSRSFAVPEVDLTQAKALIDAGALVFDVRNRDAFDHRHLPPAVLLPLAVLRAGTIPEAIVREKERQIVVYCNDGHTSGPEAAHLLREQGFKNVVNMKPGIEGWAAAGLPMIKAS